MITFNRYKEIEKKLRKAAEQMPEPTKPLPLLPMMEEKRECEISHQKGFIWRARAVRIAVFVLLIFAACSTTILASSPKLRTAIAHLFSSGVTEEIPIRELESEEPALATEEESESGQDLGALSGNSTKQTAGSITLVQDVTLDSHFTASYASSPDYLALEETPSGEPLFMTSAEDGTKTYYSVKDGTLEEINLELNTRKAVVQFQKLPGVMSHGGDGEAYRDLEFPPMEFTVSWKQYGSDVLIDDTQEGDRFDIGSAYGVDLGNNYDGAFFCRALKGQENIIEVLFFVDAQLTSYQYPFLLNVKTGEVSDPLASVDLSDWDCITELIIEDDLATATAMAGSSHEDLREISIDLNTGIVTEKADPPQKPPVEDVAAWFPVDGDTLFYVTGTQESGNGYLYDAKTGKSELLFTDAADYIMWGGAGGAVRYWRSLGYGYLSYYADDTVSLINLKDGGTRTVLEGIPMSKNVDCFINDAGTVACIFTYNSEPFYTKRLCLMDLRSMEAWYFDRDLPEGIEEWSYSWNGEYGYVIQAKNTETDLNYIYLYQYTP